MEWVVCFLTKRRVDREGGYFHLCFVDKTDNMAVSGRGLSKRGFIKEAVSFDASSGSPCWMFNMPLVRS